MAAAPDYWLGDRLVRPSLGEIHLGLERIHVEPRSMQVLRALRERAGEVVPKRELIEAVWGDAFVTDEVLTHAIWDLRRALGDHASDPEFIQTVPKLGYRLIAPVRERGRELGRGGKGWRWRLTRGLGALVAAGLALVLVRAGAPAGLWERGGALVEVLQNHYFWDRDMRPWISLRRHDVLAVRDFLFGVSYTYRNETGSQRSFTSAIERDADFVAPRVWHTWYVVHSGSRDAVPRHRAQLERVYDSATGFEKAMIEVALAYIDDRPRKKHLELALRYQPENRQVRFNLADVLLEQGDVAGAWRHAEPLVRSGWRFPGVYPLAAKCALRRGDLTAARRALEAALGLEVVDPESLALLVLMAVYDADGASEERLRWELIRREHDMRDETVELDLEAYVELLAGRAVLESRPAVAARLRESAL